MGRCKNFLIGATIAVVGLAYWLAPPPVKPIPDLKTYVKENMFKGPLKNAEGIEKLPCLGVYVFVGLEPVVLTDFSHAKNFNPETGEIQIAMSGNHWIYEHGGKPHPSGLSGYALARIFWIVNYYIQFIFDDNWNDAAMSVSMFNLPFSFDAEKMVGLHMYLDHVGNGVYRRPTYKTEEDMVNDKVLHEYFLYPLIDKNGVWNEEIWKKYVEPKITPDIIFFRLTYDN